MYNAAATGSDNAGAFSVGGELREVSAVCPGPHSWLPDRHRYFAISLKSLRAAWPFKPCALKDRSRLWLMWS